MKKINKKQKDFLKEILDNRLPVETAMGKCKIDAAMLCQWFSSQPFTTELANRIECMTKRADMLISQHRLTAIEKLILLTNCDKEETARKACIDIIELTANGKNDEKDPETPQFSQQTAAKLLEILANGSET